MSIQEQVDQTLKLIGIHRKNARVYNTQIAIMGTNASPYMHTQLAEARKQIKYQVDLLANQYSIIVEPDPIDDEINITQQVLDDLESAIRGYNIKGALELLEMLRTLL